MVCKEVLCQKSIKIIRQQDVYNYTVGFQSLSVTALLLAEHDLLEGQLENFRAPEVFTHARLTRVLSTQRLKHAFRNRPLVLHEQW